MRNSACLLATTVALLLATPLAALAGGPPGATTARGEDEAGALGARNPAFSPDGKWVYFGLRGDVWRVPSDGGDASRLTLHEANDMRPRPSPDGKWVAFSSKRSGNYDVFIMPAEGGQPRQLTFHEAADIVTDWSPDGSQILFASDREGSFDLYVVSSEGGTPRRLTFDGGVQGRFSPDGKRVVYARGAVSLAMKEYRGSSNFDLWTVPAEGGTPARVTKTPWNERDPAVSKDGQFVYYCAEPGPRYGIWRVPLAQAADLAAGGHPAPRPPELVTEAEDGDLTSLSLSADGREAVYVKGFRLYRLNLETKRERPIAIHVRSDDKGWTTENRKITAGAKQPATSPDGQLVTFSLRGDIWVMPAAGGEARRVTSGPGNDEWPRFSPDGKRIAFQSNTSGNVDIFVIPADGGKPQQVTSAPADDFYHEWAPDGRSLVYSSETGGVRHIWRVALEGGAEPVQLTRGKEADDDAIYSPDGQWIAFDSARGGGHSIWVMRPDGTALRKVTSVSGTDQVPAWSPDGRLIAFESERGGARGVYVVSVRGGPEMQVASDGGAPFWSPAGDRIVYEGGETGISSVPAPKEILQGASLPFIAQVQVDRKQEWHQVFEEAWLAIKEGFYDPKLHGVNWDEVKKKYEPLVAQVEIKDDLLELIDQMLGELKASHMGIYGASEGGPEVHTGYLGFGLAPLPAGGTPATPPGAGESGPGMIVTSVVPGGPADKAWIRAGDRIFSIDGHALDARADIYEILANKVDASVKLEVGGTGERREGRTLVVKPLGREKIRELEYAAWVKRREETTADRGRGKVGYIHLNAMDQENLQRFSAALNGPLKDRAALVIDVRNNGGGNIHQQLLDILSRRPYIYYDPRAGDRSLQETPVWAKPVCVLCNERSYSDAEIFPYGFKTLGLGKVIGAPTSGGVIGTGARTLSDGSTLRMPYVGWYGLDGKNLERWGIQPDIVVEETAEDRAHDRDPQLARAIDEMLGAIGEKTAPIAPPAETPQKGAESKRTGNF